MKKIHRVAGEGVAECKTSLVPELSEMSNEGKNVILNLLINKTLQLSEEFLFRNNTYIVTDELGTNE